MWSVSDRFTPKRPAQHTENIPLEQHIGTHRQQLVDMRNQAGDLYREAEALRKRSTSLTQRYQIRQRKEILRRADALTEEADMRVSARREAEFEDMVAPYLHAYSRRVDFSDDDCAKRNIAMPGSVKRRETIDAYIMQTDATANRQTCIVNEYLLATNNHPPKMNLNMRDVCPLCKNDLRHIQSRSILICTACGYTMTHLDATMSSMAYSDDVEFSSFSYKRINHFNEWLQQVQAKENFEVDDAMLQRIMEELYRQRITNVKDITAKKIREVLKTLKLRKAYEHVAIITSKITGVEPFRIPPEAEEMCRIMFIAVQPSFERHCPKNRKNFLSYSYCIYKFFELLGYDEFLDQFSLLKGRDKLSKQDDIFEKICHDLDWEFVRSV